MELDAVVYYFAPREAWSRITDDLGWKCDVGCAGPATGHCLKPAQWTAYGKAKVPSGRVGVWWMCHYHFLGGYGEDEADVIKALREAQDAMKGV